jgi:hypothetical protein
VPGQQLPVPRPNNVAKVSFKARGNTDRGYALLGRERNGVFLT